MRAGPVSDRVHDLRTRAGSWSLLGILLLAGCRPYQAGPLSPDQSESIRRVVAILDYVAADYGDSVDNGLITSSAEFAEQKEFLRNAREIVLSADLGELVSLERIARRVEARADPGIVANECRILRRRLLDRHGIVLAPAEPPMRERAARQYVQNCQPCHGARGGGDGPSAAQLKPRPRSFWDPHVMSSLSPVRAYNALTDGVPDTAMPTFRSFTAADRWGLAFYVLTLRHGSASLAKGASLYAKSARHVPATPTRLADMTDGEVDNALAQLEPTDRHDVLAFLRVVAPYAQTGAPFDLARAFLADTLAAYEEERRPIARQVLNAAYLQGFAPHEAALGTRDEALAVRIQEQFLGLRQRIEEGAPLRRIERDLLRLSTLLDRAEESLADRSRQDVAFSGAGLLLLRKGLEAVLLLWLLISLSGAGRDVRAAHLGWLVASLLGLATWFASPWLVELGGVDLQLTEGLIALLQACMLLLVGHQVLGDRRCVAILGRGFAEVPSGLRRAVLFTLAFVVVYRQAFAVVLFLRALMLDLDRSNGIAVLGGALLGVLLGAIGMLLLFRFGRPLSTTRLLGAMGALLGGLAVVLVGKGVRSLQEAGWLENYPLDLPRIEWLGFFPSMQTFALQAGLLAIFTLLALRRIISASQKNLAKQV